MSGSRSGITIRRLPQVDEEWGTLDINIHGADSMTLPPEGVRTVFLLPKPVQIDIMQGARCVCSQVLEMPADTKMNYVLVLAQPSLLDRLLNRPAKLHLAEQSRERLAPYDPGPVKMITQQIWIGTAKSKGAFFAFMGERDAYYSEENEEAEGTDQHIGLSAFADAMGQDSYDHDFLEYGWSKDGHDLETRFAGHSWVGQWAPLVREKLPAPALVAANAFIIMGVDESPKFGKHLQIRTPKDVETDGITLRYLGEVTHPSH